LASLGLMAWFIGLTADMQVWERQSVFSDATTTTTTTTTILDQVGVSGFVAAAASNGNGNYKMEYTLAQKEVLMDSTETGDLQGLLFVFFNLARYLYFVAAVLGPVAVNLLLFSAWHGILSSSSRTISSRRLALLCSSIGGASLGILALLYYTSPLCDPNQYVELHYRSNSNTNTNTMEDTIMDVVPYATTATVHSDAFTSCTPGDGTYWLMGAAGMWFLIALIVLRSTPNESSKGDEGDDEDDYHHHHHHHHHHPVLSLSEEPLLDPPARTLGIVAILNILAVFALVPYWTQSALMEMSPKVPPFSTSAHHQMITGGDNNNSNNINNNSLFHAKQIIGPTFFNPPQNIPYSEEQDALVQDAYQYAIPLAWVPMAVNVLVILPLVLYGRHRLTHNHLLSLWPYAVLVVLCLVGAAVTLAIPGSVIFWSDLCGRPSEEEEDDNHHPPNDRYPEFLFDELAHGGWQGTGVTYHRKITASCWPNAFGQIVVLGAVAFATQAGLLVMYCFQYSNAQDTLLTFEGIEEDVEKRLLARDAQDEEDDEEEKDNDDDDDLEEERPPGLRHRSRSEDFGEDF
jgi:hypothetical protein